MKKILLFLLILSILLTSLCIPVFAYEQEEIVSYEKTNILLEENSFLPPSSTELKKWNTNYSGGAQSMKTIADPKDSSNKVGFYGYYKPGATGILSKQKGMDFTLQTSFEADFYIPNGENSVYASSKYNFNLLGNDFVQFNQVESTSTYKISVAGKEIGTLESGSWLHIYLEFQPTDVGEKSALGDATFSIASTTLKNTSSNSVATLSSSNSITTNKNSFTISCSVLSDASNEHYYGWLLDNTTIYVWQKVVEKAPIEKIAVENYDSSFVMPDKYSTGPRYDVVPVEEKYPDLVTAGFSINDKLAEKYNYEFSGFEATVDSIIINTTKDITFSDCIIHNTGFYAFKNNSKSTLYVDHIIGTGSKSAFFSTDNLVATYCEIYDCGGDIAKANNDNIVYKYCYFHDAGTLDPTAHADGIQFSGIDSDMLNNIKVIGCRIDMPSMAEEHVANACIFYSVEQNSVGFANVQMIGNWFNGGGHTVYLMAGKTGVENNQYITFAYNKTGNGYNYSTLNVGGWTANSNGYNLDIGGGSYNNNEVISKLDVGSIVYYDGTTRVTSLSDVTSGNLNVLLNFANYNLSAHNYKISYVLLNESNKIVTEKDITGTIRKYTSPKEYNVASNMKTEIIDGKEIKVLINNPNLPSNVEVTLDIDNLPKDLTGYSLSILVEDTTASNSVIRSSVLSDKTYENTLSKLPEGITHKVVFKSMTGTVISTQTVKDGKSAIAPTAPSVTGYRFVKWSTTYNEVKEDLEVTAIYELIPKYTVTFKNLDGTTMKEVSVYENTTTSSLTPLVKEGYVFKSWTKDGKAFDFSTKITSNIALQMTVSIDSERFTSAMNKITDDSSKLDIKCALNEAKDVLSLWTDDEITTLNSETFNLYTQETTKFEESILESSNELSSASTFIHSIFKTN